MAAAGIVILFLLMLAAPCVIALHSAEQGDQPDPAAIHEPLAAHRQPEAVDPVAAAPVLPPLTLAEAAEQAEFDAMIAQDLARNAHWAALEAAARATRLRAEAAAEAAAMAQLDYDSALFDLPRVRTRGQAA